jgi:heat-inducible transcriptional repressor
MTSQLRSRRVLAALVREYIASGEPVPSSALAGAGGLEVSSATVRNILAQLETEGFLQQPHTSAGRVPTDLGYRCYVDLLLESKRPSRAATAVEARLRRDTVPLVDQVLVEASHVVSKASGTVGFAVGPAHESAVFDHIDFVPLGGTRILVIVVGSGGHVLQKAIDAGEVLDSSALRSAANYLNAEFAGLPLHRARQAVRARLTQERLLYDELMARAMRLASSTFADLDNERPLYVEGAASLLEGFDGLDLSTLQDLLEMIEEKQRLVRLLDAYLDGRGLTVVIGAEHPEPSLRSFSLVASAFDDGAGTGTIGVIGPTRMHYSRAIAIVESAAQAVSRLLRDAH